MKLGIERAHLLQVQQSPGGLRVRCAASVPYPESRAAAVASPAAFKSFIRSAMRGAGCRARSVVTSMAPESTKLMMINFTVKSGQDESATLLAQLKDRLAAPLSDWVLDYVPIRQQEKDAADRSALVAAARRRDVIEHLELYRHAGLDVEAMEIGPIAIRRLVTFLRSPEQHDNFLTVNVGEDKSFLTVLWGRRLVMDRAIDFGRENIIGRLCRALDITPEHAESLLCRYGFAWPGRPSIVRPEREDVSETITEILKPAFLALVEEINKALVFIASETRGGSVLRCYLLGCMSIWPAAEVLLGSLLSIPVSKLDPFAGFESQEADRNFTDLDRFSGMVFAAGHALRGMGGNAGL